MQSESLQNQKDASGAADYLHKWSWVMYVRHAARDGGIRAVSRESLTSHQ